jgi:multidrug efflux pump subunit AcrA (membrane-fusion protein)
MKWGGALALAMVAGLVMFFAMHREPAAPPPAPLVHPARPMVQIVAGHIEAQHTVPVEIAGQIAELLVDVGQHVSEGQAIARLAGAEPVDGSALTSAQSRAASLKNAVDESKLESAKAKADAQRAKDQAAQARKVFEREQKLNEIGATPRQSLERAQRDFEAAQSESGKVEEQWREADNRSYALADQLRDATAAAETAAKQGAAAQAKIAAAEIHAPVSGMVIARDEHAVRIAVDLDQLRAVFPVAPGIKQDEAILVTVAGLESAPIHAVISAIDQTNAIADFKSPSPAILPGAQCSVSIQLK